MRFRRIISSVIVVSILYVQLNCLCINANAEGVSNSGCKPEFAFRT